VDFILLLPSKIIGRLGNSVHAELSQLFLFQKALIEILNIMKIKYGNKEIMQ